jgi:hypothetical protein
MRGQYKVPHFTLDVFLVIIILLLLLLLLIIKLFIILSYGFFLS